MKEKLCFYCRVPLLKSTSKYKGLKFDSLKCPKCKRKIFTEELAHKAACKLEAKRLEEEYSKKPIKIGNSWAITFPKEVAKVFNINSNMPLKLRPNLKKGKIELFLDD